MYNGKAYVSTNSVRVPVYAFDDDNITLTNNRIGWIYPNECFGMHPTEASIPFVTFRNSSGVPTVGGFDTENEPTSVLYKLKKSNGTTLVDNTPDNLGRYYHTLSKNMNWYIGTTQQANYLPQGTIVEMDGQCETGAVYYYRVACFRAKRPTDTDFIELNPGSHFWIDFLSTGSMPSNRSLW